ncbi:MAG: hypothetical protein ACEQR8_03065 [Cypionkella sp.]
MFTLGFALGTARVLFVEPSLGRWMATLIELPLMLCAAWAYAAWLIGRFQVARTAAARWAMGGCALLLMLAAEFALGVTLFGRSAAQQVQAMISGPGLAGLAGQLIFAAIP